MVRIQVDFTVNKNLEFYTPLNEAMTAYIYRAVSKGNKRYAEMLHHNGFSKLGYKKFVYHVYSISQNKEIVQFDLKEGTASLILSSALEDTIVNFVKGMFKIGSIQLLGFSFNVKQINYIKEPEISDTEAFNAISPVYATRSDGKWLNPREMEKKLADNLIQKYFALYGKIPGDVKIKILSPEARYIRYKKDTFRGYTGLIIMEGDKRLIRLAYDSGLGARCGQGMGLLEKIEQ